MEQLCLPKATVSGEDCKPTPSYGTSKIGTEVINLFVICHSELLRNPKLRMLYNSETNTYQAAWLLRTYVAKAVILTCVNKSKHSISISFIWQSWRTGVIKTSKPYGMLSNCLPGWKGKRSFIMHVRSPAGKRQWFTYKAFRVICFSSTLGFLIWIQSTSARWTGSFEKSCGYVVRVPTDHDPPPKIFKYNLVDYHKIPGIHPIRKPFCIRILH